MGKWHNAVAPADITVFEVMYAYINPEVSEAYPHRSYVSDIPPGTKYYFTREACQEVCNRINRSRYKNTEHGND